MTDASRREYRALVERLAERGAEGVILACTELTLLAGAGATPLPELDTTAIHARAAAERALASDGPGP